jgi:hypothetical protein
MNVLDNNKQQVFRNLGLSKFGGIEELLSESKARYLFHLLVHSASTKSLLDSVIISQKRKFL